jgi:3-oxoadipate CoA-transferase, beta subunit
VTGLGCVSRVYTDLAVIDVTPEGFKLVDAVAGLTKTELETLSKIQFI